MPRNGTTGRTNEIAEGRSNWSPRMQSQHMTFKEMADEFMLKLKIVSEQKDELANSFLALQEEKIVLRERLQADWTKEVEETT